VCRATRQCDSSVSSLDYATHGDFWGPIEKTLLRAVDCSYTQRTFYYKVIRGLGYQAAASHAQAAKLIEPGKRPLDDPAPPAQSAPVRGATHGEPRQDVTRPQSATNRRLVVAPIPEHAVRALPRSPPFAVQRPESHPPTRGPPASRSGSRRSGEPRAARPARRRSDGACSRAWPIIGIRPRLVTAADRADGTAVHDCPRPINLVQASEPIQERKVDQIPDAPPVASRARAASTSSPTRTRLPCGSICQGVRCGGQSECR
jgi:hypothetical protein